MTTKDVAEHMPREYGPHDRYLDLTRMRQAQMETSWDVAKQHAHRWPQIIVWSVVVATALLAATGWLG